MVDQESVRFIRRAIQRAADRINRKYGGIIDRVRRIFVVELAVRTAKEVADDDVSHMAAGVAYYALFSIFPLLLGLISVMGFFLDAEEAQARVQEMTSGFLPGSEQLVADNISAVVGFRGALGVFSLMGLLVVRQRHVWRAEPRDQQGLGHSYRQADLHQQAQAASYGNECGRAVCYLALQRRRGQNVGRSGEPGFPRSEPLGEHCGTDRASGDLAQPDDRDLPDDLQVHAQYQDVLEVYLAGSDHGSLTVRACQEPVHSSTWDDGLRIRTCTGSIAPVIVLLLWAYVSSLILLLGAEISSEYERLKHNVERGVLRHRRQKPSQAPGGPH